MKYKRIVVSQRGGPEAMQLIEETRPEPASGEVRVKTLAAGVAFGDTMRRAGKIPGVKFPFIPGYELAGIAEKLGEGVTGITPGQMVAGLPMTGGYSEYINVSAANLVPTPDENLDPARVAATVVNYLTAYQMLYRVAQVKTGGKILFHGAAGGVGTAMLQLAMLDDITVYGTASQPKHDLVRELGGIPIDYRSEDFVARVKEMSGGGVDAAFDPIGGKNLWRSAQTVRRGGNLVGFGIQSAAKGSRFNTLLTFGIIGLVRVLPGKSAQFYSLTPNREGFREDLARLLSLLSQGKIDPVIAQRLPLAEARRAHELLERSAVSGKIVLVMN